eukprot:819578-Pleurochrysis_carterae.AAC.1
MGRVGGGWRWGKGGGGVGNMLSPHALAFSPESASSPKMSCSCSSVHALRVRRSSTPHATT